jgi:putative DNA primase/helicase
MIGEDFMEAMAQAGIHVRGPLLADGRLRRVHIEGDRKGSRNGWYILYSDGIPSGTYGSWKTGFKGTWCEKAQSDLTPAQRAEHKRRMDEARKAREAEEQAARKLAQDRAAAIWKVLASARDDHTYLVKKGVKAHGLRLSKGALVIPLRDEAGTLHSLQFIDGGSNKRFLSGGRKKGCYFAIGVPKGTICICEGYATGASVYESSGHAVAVAFDAGNLIHVAKAMRRKFPEAKIIICADNDTVTPGNPGLTRAREAAAAVGGLLTMAE